MIKVGLRKNQKKILKKNHSKIYYIWWNIKLEIIRKLHNFYKSSKRQNELLVREKIVSENGCPLVCLNCGHDYLIKYREYYEESGLVEYSLKCEKCETHAGTWSYGCWMTF